MGARGTPHRMPKELGQLGTGSRRTVMHKLGPSGGLLAFFAHIALTWLE